MIELRVLELYMYIHVYLRGVADFTLIHFYYNFIIELD